MYGLKEGEEYTPWLWPVPEGGVIGKRGVRRLDGYEKASGKGTYTRDVYRPGMLYAKAFLSPYAHARIKSMNTSKAEALPGVTAVLRYDDPEISWNVSWAGWGTPPVPSILPDTADWYAAPMGAVVVADSEAIVDEALKLIEIEWEELPVIVDWNEALKPGAPLIRPDKNPDSNLIGESIEEHGDVEEGFAEADNITEFTSNNEEDVWACTEALSGVAEWKEDYLEVWYHGQCPARAHQDLSRHVSMDKIRVYPMYNGGFFGGLTWLGYPAVFSNFAAIAARRVGRPVKMLFDQSHFHGTGQVPGRYNFKVGFKDDGTVTAVEIHSVYCESSLSKLWAATRIPNLYLVKTKPYVNRAPQVCYRHGGVASAIMTMVFDHVAGELGMDPTEMALKNDGCNGHDMAWVNENVKAPQGFDPTRDSLKEVLEVGKKAIDWKNKWHAPGTKKLPNGKMHGIGFTWIPGWSHSPGQSTTGIKITYDGTVNILCRHGDGGWVAETTDAQVVADELGLKYEDVTYRAAWDPAFDAKPGGGSSGMIGTLASMVRSARKAKQLLLKYAVEPQSRGKPPFFPDKTPEELDVRNSEIFEKANPENKFPVVEVVRAFSTRRQGPFFAWDFSPPVTVTKYIMIRQCYFMEVEVDTETGKVEVTRVVVVNDVGKVMNPEACNGQQYGGSYMGIGRSNTEEVFFDPKTGVKLNGNLIGYAIPLMNDVGPIDTHLVETGLSYGAYGTAGIAENSAAVECTLTGPAVYNALGVWVDEFPTTPEKVLKALGKA